MELTKEHFELIPKIDISTPEKLAQFKAWQNDDGTIEGLRKLYEAQQSVHWTGLTLSEVEASGATDEIAEIVSRLNPPSQ
jgi:hypothetical protein